MVYGKVISCHLIGEFLMKKNYKKCFMNSVLWLKVEV